MLLNFFNRQKPLYGTIKLYKVVDYDKSVNFKSAAVIDICVSELYAVNVGTIRDIEVNYGNKHWKKYASFQKFIEKNPDYPITSYMSYIAEDNCGSLFFGNGKLNKIEIDNTTDYIDIIITFPPNIVNVDFVQKFIGKLFKIETFDYGYVCFLPQNFSVLSERKSNKNTSKDIEIERNLIHMKSGFVKGVYPINILNEMQIRENKIYDYLNKHIGVLHEIETSNLKIWELQNDEIESINLLKKAN